MDSSPIMRLPNRFSRSVSSRMSVDCYVPVDVTLPVEKNIAICLDNLVLERTVAKARVLGHLNNLVSILRKKDFKSEFPIRVLLCSLRLGLVSESKEMRTASLRCLRHAVRTRQDLRCLYNEHIEYYIVRCLDVVMENENERVHAIRLIRHLASLDPGRIPRIIVHAVAAVCTSADDSLRNVCLETFCEFAIMNSRAFGHFDIITLLLHCAIDAEQPLAISDVILGVILHLLNRGDPCCTSLDLEYVISPLMELYFHHPRMSVNAALADAMVNKLDKCKLALNIILSSWTGVSRLCTADPCGIRSLINLLCISNARIQRFIMDVIFQQLFAKVPEVKKDFRSAVLGFAEMGVELWSLEQGFVVREGYDTLLSFKNANRCFVDQHNSIVMVCLIESGLCAALVDVATGTPDQEINIQATLLLAEVLHTTQKLLPAMFESVSTCVSALLSQSASDSSLKLKSRARQTVNRLHRYQAIKNKRLNQISLFLQAIVHQTRKHKHPLTYFPRDGIEVVEPVLRDFQAMSPKDNRTWDWDIISMVLESAYDLPKSGVDDEGQFRFIRRLVHFFKPSSRFYSIIRLDEDNAHSLTLLACQLIVFLMDAESAEGSVMLYDLLEDIGVCLRRVAVDTVTSDELLGPSRIRNSLCQHYFLMIGHLTHYSAGEQFLERSGLVEILMDLIAITRHTEYVKLTIASLNYCKNTIGKVVLCKALTGTSEEARVFACHFLALLMRFNLPDVNDWGMNLLVAQLVDQSQVVAEAALKILQNLCEDNNLLELLISILPPLMHLSDKGIFLLAQLMSVPSGFKVFANAQVVTQELDRWKNVQNEEYVRQVEKLQDNASVSTPVLGLCPRYPPIHLYGQLAQHQEGFEVLTRRSCIAEYLQHVRLGRTNNAKEIMTLKTSLWVLGNIGSSEIGVEWLEHEAVLSCMLTLSTCASVHCVRATAFNAVNLVTRTDKGRMMVERYGWTSLLHDTSHLAARSPSPFRSPLTGSFSNAESFPDSFRKPLYVVRSCPEVQIEARPTVVRDRGQSDSIVQTGNVQQSASYIRSVSNHVTESRFPYHMRSASDAPRCWPRLLTPNSEDGNEMGVNSRPYYRSYSNASNPSPDGQMDRDAKLYMIDKIAASNRKAIVSRGLCIPIPFTDLFKLEVKKPIDDDIHEQPVIEELVDDSHSEVLKRIHQMCGIRGHKVTENELLKLKQKSPEIFQDEALYIKICKILNNYFFQQTARRFIQELFLDVSHAQLFAETRAMYAEVQLVNAEVQLVNARKETVL